MTEREKRALLIAPCIPSVICMLLILAIEPLPMNYIAGLALLISLMISYSFTIGLYHTVIRFLKKNKMTNLYTMGLCGILFGFLAGLVIVFAIAGFNTDYQGAVVFISWTSGFGLIIGVSFYLIAYKNRKQQVAT